MLLCRLCCTYSEDKALILWCMIPQLKLTQQFFYFLFLFFLLYWNFLVIKCIRYWLESYHIFSTDVMRHRFCKQKSETCLNSYFTAYAADETRYCVFLFYFSFFSLLKIATLVLNLGPSHVLPPSNIQMSFFLLSGFKAWCQLIFVFVFCVESDLSMMWRYWELQWRIDMIKRQTLYICWGGDLKAALELLRMQVHAWWWALLGSLFWD